MAKDSKDTKTKGGKKTPPKGKGGKSGKKY